MDQIRTWFIAALILHGCYQDGSSVDVQQSYGSFNVRRLFKVDGCNVYGFEDGGRRHYFANCRGSVSGTEYDGKNQRPVEIPTEETK